MVVVAVVPAVGGSDDSVCEHGGGENTNCMMA